MTKDSRYLLTKALVIQSRLTQEQDKSVTLFTPSLGLISALAKGIQSIRSRRAGLINSGNLIQARLCQKHDYYYLSEGKIINSFAQLRSDLAVFNAFHLLLFTIKYLYRHEKNNDDLSTTFQQTTKHLEQAESLAPAKRLQQLLALNIYHFAKSGFISYPLTCQYCNKRVLDLYLSPKLEISCDTCRAEQEHPSWGKQIHFQLDKPDSRLRFIYELQKLILGKEFKPIV